MTAWPAFAFCLFTFAFVSCGSKPTDLRTLAPAETLVYLETNDLGAALQPIVDSKPFTEAAKSRPDLSALKGVQLAVAVTGFETSEEKLTDEQSVGKVQPHFVAIADTHAWNFQAVGFAEKKLGGFVARLYDSEPKLDQTDKSGGKYFTWTAGDGRKAYALVVDSVIYFTNDESVIDKCLAVKRGEADSIAKDGKVKPADPATLASGYISTDGVAQIANIAGLKFASDASDESEIQSAIAGILPKLIRGTITDATWTQTKTDTGLQDTWQINMPPDVANVFNETMAPSEGAVEPSLYTHLPKAASATRYNLKSPASAWKSLFLVVKEQSGSQDYASLIRSIAESFFAPYGITDPSTFLTSVDPNILTARLDPEGEDSMVIARVIDAGGVRRSIDKHLGEPANLNDHGASVRKTEDGDIGAVFENDDVVIGSTDAIARAFGAGVMPGSHPPQSDEDLLKKSSASITSLGTETNRDVLGFFVAEDAVMTQHDFIETRFNRSGMERKTTSDLGFIGWIIAQLADND